MTVSKFFAGYLKRTGVARPVKIISNGVDTELFKPGSSDFKTRRKYGFDDSQIIFFYLGRLDRDKNVETIVRAMPGTNKNIKILIVGRGTQSRYLSNLAKKLGVSDKIKWTPYVTDSEMFKISSFVDAFCIMSPFEGQSIVTLQAVAMGLPVIAANAGALPELVADGVNGYLVDTYDASALSKKMNLLAESGKLRQEFGRIGRKVSLKHERSKALRKLESIYIMLHSAKR
jgi:glycosyltransferase involved in cell wall biosynthesis